MTFEFRTLCSQQPMNGQGGRQPEAAETVRRFIADTPPGTLATCRMDGSSFSPRPFVPTTNGDAGREFVALFLFGRWGHSLEARIDDLGARADLGQPEADKLYGQRLAALGDKVESGRIEVRLRA